MPNRCRTETDGGHPSARASWVEENGVARSGNALGQCSKREQPACVPIRLDYAFVPTMSDWLLTASLACCLATLVVLLYFALKTRNRFRKQSESQRKQLLEIRRGLEQLKVLNEQQRELQRRVNDFAEEHRSNTQLLLEAHQEAVLVQGVVSTLPFKYPIFFGGWAIDGFLAREIVGYLERLRPKVVLELGCGTSTVLIAAVLDKLGLETTRHIAVDHLDEFIDVTRRQLELQGLATKTEFWHCPLVETTPGGPAWYDGVATRLSGTLVDLAVVDGPPGSLHPQSRWPALDVLHPFLSERAVVLVDDAGRPEEQAMLKKWRATHPDLRIRLLRQGKGRAVISRRPGGNISKPCQ